MHLEKLEIQGFKSFANKNTLVFPGFISKEKRGLTAIVGPNGSGKSNIADAVRWALGEQSTKTLRGKKSEDVIFSGSDKKGQLGMAEVSLYLKNEDKKSLDNDPDSFLQYSEIVITRKLFRSGESQYLINNQKVRLSDIQMLLAKANFGQKTYSVIGQGIVENFLNTSPSERKDFFDEATGVKKYQIKRDMALNKLINSYDNLEQAQLLVSEIEPRLRSLTRQVEKLRKRADLEKELKKLQYKYYGLLWQELNKSLQESNSILLEKESHERNKNQELEKINNKLSNLEKIDTASQEKIELRTALSKQQNEIQQENRKLAQIEAKIEMSLEAKGKFDLSWLHQKEAEIKNRLEEISKEHELLEKKLNEKTIIKEYPETETINTKIRELNNQILQLGQKQPELKTLLKSFWLKFKNLDLDNDKLKDTLQELKKDFQEKIAPNLEDDKNNNYHQEEIENIQTKIESLSQEKAEITEKAQEEKLEIYKLEESISQKGSSIISLNNELKDIERKLASQEKTEDTKDLNAEKDEITKTINNLKSKENEVYNKLNTLEEKDKLQRQELFELQKQAQTIQQEINTISLKLNDVRVQSARKETRLEDLENEIRKNELSLGTIKQTDPDYSLDKERAYNKIESNKKQLELIGGIDPETEAEYQNTKERFDFLSKQSQDLQESIHSLEKIISELDYNIKKQFDKEFKVIEEKFKEYFKQLFSGGQATLNKISAIEKEKDLEDEDEKNLKKKSETETEKIRFLKKHNATGLSGIEIQACPPGKKIKSISMLSGGERALTAIALICAIISANPAPFVVLDEVDAALDEANSERLAQILDTLSHKTQFIVVTHNRASMRKASLLYGVTMSDDGVSHLLSVKLEDIKTQSDIKNLNKKA